MDRSNAINVLKTLKANCSKYFPEHQALDYAISFLENYETRLKADMVAMLTEIQLEIEEQKRDELSYQQTWNYPLNVCVSIIQQKIDALKGADMEVTIDKCCTSKETYTVDDIISIMENLLYDMRNSDGGEGALIVDGQKFYTDAGFALEGVEIFIKLFKQRMEVEENVDTDAEQTENSKQ